MHSLTPPCKRGLPVMSFVRKIIAKVLRRKQKAKNDASIYPMF
ncbi:hypothetical protein YUWDRAFT_06117 [Streptomyces sp. AmelKG-D3]|nr:hypothetical protein YUWDRAFT_06117 [Streptomyces sp. AmelKG-D3]